MRRRSRTPNAGAVGTSAIDGLLRAGGKRVDREDDAPRFGAGSWLGGRLLAGELLLELGEAAPELGRTLRGHPGEAAGDEDAVLALAAGRVHGRAAHRDLDLVAGGVEHRHQGV